MKDGRLKNSITYIFLVLFVSMKLAGLHVLSQTDEKDHAIHCAICDHTITNNLTPALNPDLQEFTIKNTEPFVQKEIIENYNIIISGTIATNQLFSRPPPIF